MTEKPSVSNLQAGAGFPLDDSLVNLDALNEAYIRLDRELRFTFVNRVAQPLLRMPAADLIGKTPWEARPESAITPLEENLRLAKAENRVVSFENHYAPWDRWYAITAMPDSNGGLIVHFSDITERKAAEKALKKVEERHSHLFEMLADAIVLVEADSGRFLDVNSAAVQMYGYSREEFLSMRHVDVSAEPEASYNSAKAQETVVPLRWHRKKSGAAFPVAIRLAHFFWDGRDVHLATIRDITQRKQMEDALRKSEEKFSKAFTANPACIGISDLAAGGRLIDVNEAWEQATGYSRAEAIGRSAVDLGLLVDPGDYAKLSRIIQANGKVRHFEGHFRRKNGEEAFGLTSSELIEIDGRPCAISATIDITERKAAEKALQAAEKKYREIFAGALEGIYRTTPQGQSQDANVALATMLGYNSPSELVSILTDTTHQLWFDPNERSHFVNVLETDGVIRDYECRFKRKDGTPSWVSLNCLKLRGPDEQTYYQGFVIDINERKRMENALRTSEEKFYRAFHSSPAALTIVDLATGSYVDVNGTFEQISGYGREEVIGRRWEELELWTESSNRDQALKQLLKVGNLRNWEFGFRKKNGETGTGLLSAELIEIGGKPCAITATIDVTERLQLERQLLQAQKLESVGRLAGGVAHDFSNLLTVINGYADFLVTCLDRQDRLWSSADEIRKAGERAASLTKQLLALSRKQVIEPKVLDLNATIREAERILERIIGEDIRLATRLDPSLGQVMADPEQIHQVMMNVVVNARDAMPDGGKVDISTENVEVSDIEAARHPDARPGRYVTVTVTDTGSGMDENTRQHIFEPFFTTKAADRGTGLGLFTVYGIVRQSGGWISVASDIGVGTTFRLYFPRIDGSSLEEGQEATRSTVAHGGETILVVEDQDAVRRLTRTTLEMYGYHVLESANGDEATALGQKYPGEIHLLLTDVVLPGINGKQLSERLKVARPNLKVLFMSGYTADVIGHRGVLDPGVAYIPKPFMTVAPEKGAKMAGRRAPALRLPYGQL